jgi:hypothetical protein
MRYRYRDTVYRIHLRRSMQANEPSRLWLDGVEQPDLVIALRDDEAQHEVEVVLAAPATP